MTSEERLRQLLRDPGWSLPARPGAEARVRRTARRQRQTIAGLGAAVTAVVTAIAVVPVILLSSTAAQTAAGSEPVVSVLPAIGAAGFATTIYPAAVRPRVVTSLLRLCPSQAGLQVPGRNVGVASRFILRALAQATVVRNAFVRANRAAALPELPGRMTVADRALMLSDRAFWPRLAAGVDVAVGTAQAQVIYSGPLQYYHPAHGPPGIASIVSAGCGTGLVRDTWVVISRQPAVAGQAAEALFLKRRGHVLLYAA